MKIKSIPGFTLTTGRKYSSEEKIGLHWTDYAVSLLLAHWFGKPGMQKVRHNLFLTDNS